MVSYNTGVLFQGSFNWTVAEHCARQGFWCNVISTDLHVLCAHGPVYDLVSVMSKMLHIGMPVKEIIKAVTLTPAIAIGRSNEIGSLSVGNEADITILKIEGCDIDLHDSIGQMRRVKHKFVPKAVWRAGEMCPILDTENLTYTNIPKLNSLKEMSICIDK